MKKNRGAARDWREVQRSAEQEAKESRIVESASVTFKSVGMTESAFLKAIESISAHVSANVHSILFEDGERG